MEKFDSIRCYSERWFWFRIYWYRMYLGGMPLLGRWYWRRRLRDVAVREILRKRDVRVVWIEDGGEVARYLPG